MRRTSALPFPSLLATLAGLFVAANAAAEGATLFEQPFATALTSSSSSTVKQIGSTDWWYLRMPVFADPSDPESNNVSGKFTSSSLTRYVISPPLSGNFGQLRFRTRLVPNPTHESGAVVPCLTVFLGTDTNYKGTESNWPNVPNVTEVFDAVALDVDAGESNTNKWFWHTVQINRTVDASSPLRVGLGRMVPDRGYDMYIDDITLTEAVSTFAVEDDLYVTANSTAADPAAAATAVAAGSNIAPHVSFTRFLDPTDLAVTLHYRTMPGGTWQTRDFPTAVTNDETGVITYALSGNSISVGAQSGTQVELYATATYANEEGAGQAVAFANTAANPLRIDVLPESPAFPGTHADLVVAGALSAPMDATTNGVWTGVLERSAGVGSGDTWFFDFGEGAAETSRTYGDGSSTIPFKNETVRVNGTFPAPASLDRDVSFRYSETKTSASSSTTFLGAALTGEAQTFENWAATQANGWSLGNASGSAAVVEDDTLAFHGTHALLLAAGDSLVLDKTALAGVREIGFWVRRAGDAAASVAIERHQAGQAANDTLATVSALPTDRYVFQSLALSEAQNPMGTDGIVLRAVTPVYLDDVFVADSATAEFASVGIDLEPPLRQYDAPTVVSTFALAGGAQFRNGVSVVWGQGDNASSATNTVAAYYDAEEETWSANLPALERGDADLYYYVAAAAFDFGNDGIGTLVSPTNCVPVIPSSGFDSLAVMRSVDGGAEDSSALRLARDGLWKGAIAAPSAAQANVSYQFENDAGNRFGGEDGASVPGAGELVEDGSLAAESVDSAMAFEFDENEGTYSVREAKYAPLDGSLPAGWTATGATHSSTGTVFQANGTLIVPGCTGVGQVFFWAKRTGATAPTYRIEYSASDSGNVWSTGGIVGATGTIAGETMRFYTATVGNNDARRIRITISGAPALVQDVVATASGSYVVLSGAQITANGSTTASSTSSGPTVSYGGTPAVSVSVAPANGATDIAVSVEAVSVDESGVPREGAAVASIPMTGDSVSGGTFTASMPALAAGRIGYRFVATYQGIDATQTADPASGYYLYTVDTDLDDQRTPDFSTLDHSYSRTNSLTIAANWRFATYYTHRLLYPDAVGFVPAANTTIIASRRAFNGIGRIYFKAMKFDEEFSHHFLRIELSDDDGNTWNAIKTVEIPYYLAGSGTFTQFCIEVNDYGENRVRFVRESTAESASCFIYLKDVVVTPPPANIEVSLSSIVHPGYPSKDDDITFRVDVANVYDSYPAVDVKPTLHWRRMFGSVAQEWNETPMSSVSDDSFECTLPAMAPGRLQYYVATEFSGASYKYAYDPSLDLRYYPLDEDEPLAEDPLDGDESSSPAFLVASSDSPEEFSQDSQQNPRGLPEGFNSPWFWFKVRAFKSHHRELRFVYTDALEPVEEGASASVQTNAMRLVGDETWLTTIPLTNSVGFLGHIYGVEPYEGVATTDYGTQPTRWGDPDQATTNAPLASVASERSAKAIKANLSTSEPVLMMVRLDTTTGDYQIRRAAYQDFNEWSADPVYYEDSTGLYDTMNYEQDFDTSALFPETAMGAMTTDFAADATRATAAVVPSDDDELSSYYTSTGWRLRNGWILRERVADAAAEKTPNVAAMIEPHAGYLENTDGDSALPDGLDFIRLRYRASIGGIGHLPYYKGGFDWKDYTLYANDVKVSQASPAHPYIQFIAAYADEDNYVAMRLTQVKLLEEKSVQNRVKQELIRVHDGVEEVLRCQTARNAAAFSGSTTSNLVSTTDNKTELTQKTWNIYLAVTNNSVEGMVYYQGGATNRLFASQALANTPMADGGTIAFDAYDAVASFGGISVRLQGQSGNETLRKEKWSLGGTPAGGTGTRWTATSPTTVANQIPPLPFTIGVCKAGESASFPSTGSYTNVYSGIAGALGYNTVEQPIHYWGNAFVRIEPGRSDARLVVDDVTVQSWRGRDLPEADPSNDLYWQARQGVVVTRDGTRQLALTTSRANPSARQMVSTPEMLQGIGTISFNYEAAGGKVAFVLERNSVSGAYADDAGFTPLDDDPIVAAAGSKGEVFRAIRLDMTGKVRIRILPDESDTDATLYVDNLFAKSFPPDDGRSWTAYNALIVAPTRNETTDAKQFEEEVTTQSAFLNNSTEDGTRLNQTLDEHSPYIQSPVIGTGIGEIGFWYRVWDPSRKDSSGEIVPGKITLWVAKATSAEEHEWQQVTIDDLAQPEYPLPGASEAEEADYRKKFAAWETQTNQFANLSSITNGSYRYFTAEICDSTNFVLRICAETNGTQRVAIDNVLVTEPVRASIDVVSVRMYPNDIPLVGEPVGFEVLLGNPKMNPVVTHVYADYFIGTDVWGVANWGAGNYESVDLEQDPDNPFLYRSPADKMIPGLPVDTVVQYRIRVVYSGTFASPIVDTSFTNPEWYEPVDLNEQFGTTSPGAVTPYYFVFSCPTGVVWINEFYPAYSAAYNAREFVELLGPDNLSLKNWTLEIVDGAASEFEDAVLSTLPFPDDATFAAPEGSTSGWGFFVAGDNDPSIADKVDLVWDSPASANLPVAGGIRLRRSMGAYVDRVSYGGGGNGNPANAMVDRGYTYAGTRLTIYSYATRPYSLQTTQGAEGDELAWRVPSGNTLGAMNDPTVAELWGDCPFTVSDEFANASAEAITKYFDLYAKNDFEIDLFLNDAGKDGEGKYVDPLAQALTAVSVGKTDLAIGSGYTVAEKAGTNGVLVVTLDGDALAALALPAGSTNTVTLSVAEGLAPTVQLVVEDHTPEPGNRSACIRPTIDDFEVADGVATLTVSFVNEDAEGTSAEGWKWAIVHAPEVTFATATTNAWIELSDADLETPAVESLDLPDADARFYKVVTSDEAE